MGDMTGTSEVKRQHKWHPKRKEGFPLKPREDAGDSSAVESTYCSATEPQFSAQLPPLTVTPVTGDLVVFSGF